MKATVSWKNKLNFEGKNEKGQTLLLSGEGDHPSPMEVVLQAVGACSSIDVVMILQKARQHISDCQCELTAERAESVPRVFTKIHAHYRVSGQNLSEQQVKRACDLSMEKYCSVSLMLKGKVEISHSYEVIELD
jgi:putative redox protein